MWWWVDGAHELVGGLSHQNPGRDSENVLASLLGHAQLPQLILGGMCVLYLGYGAFVLWDLHRTK